MSYSHSSTVPIEMLPGIGRRTAKVLRHLQIHSVGQFKTMPERVLIELFGPSISPVHQAVQGDEPSGQTVKPKSAQTSVAELPFTQRLRLATQLLML